MRRKGEDKFSPRGEAGKGGWESKPTLISKVMLHYTHKDLLFMTSPLLVDKGLLIIEALHENR
jgi:hypothetical protein